MKNFNFVSPSALPQYALVLTLLAVTNRAVFCCYKYEHTEWGPQILKYQNHNHNIVTLPASTSVINLVANSERRNEFWDFNNYGLVELFHHFKGPTISLHIVTLSCILIPRHDHVLSFTTIYFQSNLLTSHYQSFCVFLYGIYPSSQRARGSAVDWGIALQDGSSWVRFPMTSLEFFIDIILPAALWPWGWLSL